MHKQNSKMGRRKRFQILYIENNLCPFSQATYIYTEPTLHLDGQAIPVKDDVKFLGLIFDKKN